MPLGQAAKHGLPNLSALAECYAPSSFVQRQRPSRQPVDRLDGHAPCRGLALGPAESHCKSREASRTTVTGIIVVRVVFSLVWGTAQQMWHGSPLRHDTYPRAEMPLR